MAKFLFYDDKIINILIRNEKPSGGAAVQAYGWIRGLLAAGEEISVLTHAPDGQRIKEDCTDIRLIPLYSNQKGVRWVRWIYYRFPYLYRTIKRNRPDYLYEGIPCWKSFLLGIICYQLGVRYVLRISNDCFLDSRAHKTRSRVHLFFQELGMKLSYCILCQNSYQYGIIKKRFPAKKVIRISNPIYLNNDHSEYDLRSKEYIAWLGLFQYQKNLPLLFEIARMLSGQKFLIAGKEHADCDEETKLALRKLAGLPNVRFAGFLERNMVLPFLSKAKFLLNTSHYEGFSNTFLEAMSVATPIITTANVNPDDIIRQYKLGIVFDDQADLQIQLSSLAPDEYRTMSDNAAGYIRQHDYKVLSKKLLSVLAHA